MSKTGFEMNEEERILRILDAVADASCAQFVEGFADSVLTKDESERLGDLLIEVGAITDTALKRCDAKEKE